MPGIGTLCQHRGRGRRSRPEGGFVRVWIRRFAWAVGALLLLWGAAWLGGPPLLKWQAQTRLSELLGRSVTIGAVELLPWSLELTVRDVAIGPAPGATSADPQVQLGRLHVDVSGASLWRGAPVVEALDVDAPRIRLTRTAAGHYDIDDLIAKFAPKPDAPASTEPARFALYNLELRDGQLLFDDKPAGRQHRVDALHLALPFLSNLPAQVDVKVEPHLAFKFNGTPFDSGAQATPFAKNRSADLKLVMGELELAPYKPYLPASLPVRLERGAVAAEIALQFAQPEGAAPRVSVKGSVSARGLALADAAGAPLLGWDKLRVDVKDVQPLVRQVALGKVTLDAPRIAIARDAAGELNLVKLGGSAPAPAEAASSASAPAASADAQAWKIGLDGFEISGGQVAWNDAATSPPAALQLDGLTLKLASLRWPEPAAMPVELAATLHAQGDGKAAAGTVSVKGEANDRAATLALELGGLALETLAPYLRAALVPQLVGTLSATGELHWAGGATPKTEVRLAQATLAGLKLVDPKLGKAGELVSLCELVVKELALDLDAHQVSLGSVRLVQPVIALARDKGGALNVQQWLVAAPAVPAKAPPAKPAPAGEAWRVQLRDFLLDGGQVRFADAMAGAGQPLRVEVNGLRVAVQNLALRGDKTTAPARVQLAAKVGAPATVDRATAPGSLDWKGQLALAPLQVKGTAKIDRFPVHLFEPYFGDRVGVGLLRADAGWQGDVSVTQERNGIAVNAAGDVLVSDLNVHTRPASAGGSTDELLTWQALNLKGLKFAMPAQGRPTLEVAEAALSDFYSKLVITDQGRFNLQDVAAAPAAGASAPAADVPASAASAATVPEAPPAFGIRIGATRLTNGKVDFTDHFIRPNYSANLTELNGRLGAFSNESRDVATLELRGKAAGTALLEITGALNPTAKPLALDIQAKATDLELAPLSPYAGKYAGYAIERGKLSMEIAYKIDADGKLDAKNQVILNQLTFGDKVDSPDATKLPVLLAVALLKDRHGVIDINLPVSGSINDPKFSVGGIIVKVILNLLAKALTAPFSLLFGGGADEASLVEFKAGAPVINDSGTKAIDKVAKALADRPALKMTVTGAADPASEREAYQSTVLEARLLAERRKEMLREGGAPDAPVTMTAEDRTRLLKEVYKATDIPNKPRNAIGMQKDLPVPEMEAMLKARTLVTEDAMRELALQRGLAVRDALIAKGLPSERLFLAAPKLRVSGDGDAAWTPRVQLALSTQ